MKPEVLQSFLEKYLNIGEQGSTKNQEDMASLISQQSRYYRELYDIQDGVRTTADHPHHPLPSLKNSLTIGWKQIREIVRQNKPTNK